MFLWLILRYNVFELKLVCLTKECSIPCKTVISLYKAPSIFDSKASLRLTSAAHKADKHCKTLRLPKGLCRHSLILQKLHSTVTTWTNVHSEKPFITKVVIGCHIQDPQKPSLQTHLPSEISMFGLCFQLELKLHRILSIVYPLRKYLKLCLL